MPKEIDLSSALMNIADGASGAQLRFGAQDSLTVASSAEARAHAAAAIQTQLGCAGVVVFEPPATGAEYQRTYSIGKTALDESVRFMPSGTLARWLRVNEEPLILAGDAGVIKDLMPEEREPLRALGASACIPFVANDDLVAFVIACRVDRTRRTLAANRLWRPRNRAGGRCNSECRRQADRHQTIAATAAGRLAASIAPGAKPARGDCSSVQFGRRTRPASGRDLRKALRDLDRIDPHRHRIAPAQPPRGTNLTRPTRGLVGRSLQQPYASAGGDDRLEPLAEPVSIRLNEREMWQTMINLLLNVPGVRSRRHVTVRASRAVATAGIVELSVEDTGSGIAPEHLARVFDAFFTTKPGGCGIGLPFCRQAIEQHGGTISINSTPGGGTTVSVQLPTVDPHGLDPGR
jgi:hypothetical protein